MTLTGPEGIHSLQPLLPVQLDPRAIYVQANVARQLGLADGQVVQAMASSQGTQLQLRLKDQIFQMPLNPYIKDGDMAQLRAQMLANGDWALQLLHTGSFAGPIAQQALQMLQPDRLRALLFQPGGFANWLSLLEQPQTFSQLFAFEGAGGLQAAWRQQRLHMAHLQPQTIKRWLLPELTSAQARWAQGAPVDKNEPRVLLQQLLLAREQAGLSETEASQSLGRALDEMDASQLKAAQAWQRGEVHLSLVIPFADAPPVALEIEREARQAGQPTPPWILNMHTQTPSLGELWLKSVIRLDGTQRRIDLTVWALRPDVAALAMRNAPALADELTEAGLEMSGFQVFNGPRPRTDAEPSAPAHGVIVDTRA